MIRCFFAILSVLLMVAGCAMLRVMVLDDPLSPEEHLKLGMAYEKKGDYELAMREYKLAVKDIPLARLFLGNVYFLQNSYASAEKQYRRAIRELPENPRPYNNLAWLYYMQGIKLNEAEALARRAVKLAPEGEGTAYYDTLGHILRAKARELEKRPGG